MKCPFKLIRFIIAGINLTHWGWVTHICVSKLTNIGSDNGLSPDRRQATIWTNATVFLIRSLGTNFSEIGFKIDTFPSITCIWKYHLQNRGCFASMPCIYWTRDGGNDGCLVVAVSASAVIVTANDAIVGFRWLPWLPFVSQYSLQWRHNERHGFSNHQPLDCLHDC